VLFAVLFKAFDADKSGFIQKDEMAAVLKMLYLNGLKALNASTVHEVLPLMLLFCYASVCLASVHAGVRCGRP
jgi:hypothetical protein